MSDLSPAERRGKRMMGLLHLAGGFVAGKVGVGLVRQLLPGDAAASIGDEGLTLAGAAFTGYKATRGGKWMNVYAGASLALAAPTLEAIADRAMSALNLGGGQQAA